MRALTIALCLLSTPAIADVAGVASVIDGDTTEVHGQAAGVAPGQAARHGKLRHRSCPNYGPTPVMTQSV